MLTNMWPISLEFIYVHICYVIIPIKGVEKDEYEGLKFLIFPRSLIFWNCKYELAYWFSYMVDNLIKGIQWNFWI